MLALARLPGCHRPASRRRRGPGLGLWGAGAGASPPGRGTRVVGDALRTHRAAPRAVASTVWGAPSVSKLRPRDADVDEPAHQAAEEGGLKEGKPEPLEEAAAGGLDGGASARGREDSALARPSCLGLICSCAGPVLLPEGFDSDETPLLLLCRRLRLLPHSPGVRSREDGQPDLRRDGDGGHPALHAGRSHLSRGHGGLGRGHPARTGASPRSPSPARRQPSSSWARARGRTPPPRA